MATINQTLLCILLVACLAVLSVASYRALTKPLGHDEAVLLQAADSLSRGDGYASYGAMRGDGPRLFDPHITVGPVTLVPLSVTWRLTSGDVTAVRALMLAICYLYIAGLFCLFHTTKYGLLLPVLSISSFLSIANLPIGAIQGELAAATALVWSAYAIRKRRILTAALLAGLAVQIKLVFVLAGAVLLSVWIIPAFFPNGRFNLKRFPSAIAAGLIFSAPTLVFELWRFLSFADINSWMASLDEFKYFLRSQNINTTSSWLDNQFFSEKLRGFWRRYPLSAWIAAATATLLILIWAVLRRYGVKLRRATWAVPGLSYASQTHQKKVAENQFPLAIAAGLIVCGAAMLVGWVTQSAQIGNRQSLPFFFLLIPPLFALSGYCYCQATSWMSNTFSAPLLPQWRMLFSSIPICVVLLAVALAGRVSDIIRYEIAKDQRWREEQNLVLSIIRAQNAESLFVDINASGLWQNAVFQLLSPIQAIPMKTGKDQLMIVSTYITTRNKRSFDDFLGQCGNVLYRSKTMLLCRLPDFKSKDVGLQIEAWGPQLTSLHTVPNRQVIGGAAFWIRVKQVNWQKLGPLRLHLSGQPAFTTKLGDGLITGQFPARLFQQPGTYELQVKQLVGGRFFDVGQFHVLGEIASIDGLPDTVIAELVAWGPRSGEVGAGFNRQAGGRSAMWFRFSDIGQHPYRIYFGTNPLRTSVSGDKNVITASTTAEQAARLTANPREIPVHLVDLVQGGKQVLGYFLVSGR